MIFSLFRIRWGKINFHKIAWSKKGQLGYTWKKRSLLPWSKKVSTEPKFFIWMRRETLRDDSQPRIEDTKTKSLWLKACGAMKCWSLVVKLSSFCRFSLISHQLPSKSLCLSVPPCEGWFWMFLIRCSKLKNSSTKWQSPWRIVELNSKIIVSLPIDRIECSVLIIYSDSWIFCLFISPLDLLRPLVGLRPPSKSFVLSLCLSIPAVSLSVTSKTQHQNTFSLNAGALSLCHSLPQWVYGILRVPRNAWPVPQPTGAQGRVRVPRNLDWISVENKESLLPWSKKVSTEPKFFIWMRRETLRDDSGTRIWDTKKWTLMRKMVWWHEMLIPCCKTVLFLSNFSLYPIQLWFWWLSYSNHSFQLISVQDSVHHSNPPTNHQSCYQELFLSTSNWRQAHIQRHISCCPSSKAREFIASTAYRIHSFATSKMLAVPERSQKYLTNYSKYRRKKKITVIGIIFFN